jgi:hypothetical protein
MPSTIETQIKIKIQYKNFLFSAQSDLTFSLASFINFSVIIYNVKESAAEQLIIEKHILIKNK